MDWFCAAVQTFHALHVELTCVLNCPAPQGAHCRSDVVVGAAVWALPGWQVVNAEHFLSETAVAAADSYWAAVQAVSDRHCPPDSYLPAPHFEQTRSEARLGATLSVSPVAHWLHAVHCAAFTALLNVPAAHGLHARSTVVVG
jgi:hypothetical protein